MVMSFFYAMLCHPILCCIAIFYCNMSSALIDYKSLYNWKDETIDRILKNIKCNYFSGCGSASGGFPLPSVRHCPEGHNHQGLNCRY